MDSGNNDVKKANGIGEMTKKERVAAALNNRVVDRVPVAAWMHFPERDTTVDGQVEAIVGFQKKYDWDFIKLMFRSTFLTEGWGCTFRGYHEKLGYWIPESYPIIEDRDWEKIHKLDPQTGAMNEMVETVGRVKDSMEEDLFILATLFSPYMVAAQISEWNGQVVRRTMRKSPDLLHRALGEIGETIIDFGRACIENGADGIFFSAFYANTGFMTREEYAEFGHPYNKNILNALRDESEFTMLHICGNNTDYHEALMFGDFLDYPVDAYNWDDHNAKPSIQEARSKTSKCLMGGIEKEGIIARGTPQEVEAEAEKALMHAGSKGFILTPGCVLPIYTPEVNLFALRNAVVKNS
jgi:uroporphyrinogen decarboxylase